MNKKSFIYSVLALILFALYLPIDSPKGHIYSFKTFIDDLIPLWTPSVAIYISYFIFLLITWFYFFKSGRPIISNTILLSVIFACILSYAFYFAFQNIVIGPKIEVKNIFDSVYMWMHFNIPPYNAFPSLHVAISLICSAGYFAIKSKYKLAMAIWALLIILSTLLAKQHYFLDAIGGAFVAAVSYGASRYFNHNRH